MLFRNAWAAPVCAPTRAALLTGRHGFRTGLGTVDGAELSGHELTLAEALVGYESRAVGKWHLGDPLDPLSQGFASFVGLSGGGVPSYYAWDRYENGVATPQTEYVTTVMTDDAIAALGAMKPPWLLYVAYNAPHAPFEAPPAHLCPSLSGGGACAGVSCGNLSGSPSTAELVRAMTEALDTELGRLLDAVALADPNAHVFFLGDNGTVKQAAQAPFVPEHGKGELNEGGLNVPLLVKGPGVVQGESAALVSVVDLFATLTELALATEAADWYATDSVSFAPCLADPAAGPRTFVYAERFGPSNSPGPWANHEQAVREARYKLIRRAGQPDELYDLELDPFESTDLLPTLDPAAQAAYDALGAELARLRDTPPTAYCTAGTSSGGCRASLHAIGKASASAPSGLVLSAQGGQNRPGLFYFGTGGRQAAPWGNGTSFQCVAPPVRRTPLVPGGGATPACTGAHAFDLNALWCPTCPGGAKNPGPGVLVQAQLWYRDPQNTSNQTTSLSNAIEVHVAP